ncbi:MAG: cysteine--tRNA ligase [Elusimicrobia bacterium]|nr:cysteine--tRNA ligase [Elusimicrobiota bacterium]
MALHIHNTLSGKKEPFQPLDPGRVKMYVCGVTPYDESHLGHARCYVVFDFIRRSLRRLGYEVAHVQNFTDIDDKIIRRARERGEDPSVLAERCIQDYFGKMDRLNIERAGAYPRVTQHIPPIVASIGTLVEKGLAYAVEGDVYYAVRSFPGYGKLSKRSLDDLKSGARVDVDERKRDPLDFALWKAAKPGEPAWDSPWGKGRPGWHIECSVMSLVNLNAETFDIHGGGQDLIFPHHENEIAQAEGATGKPFARYWIHNGFVTVNKEKMSKSLGNFFSLSDIFAKYDPRAVRLLLLSQHYRTPLEVSDELLTKAASTLQNAEETVRRLKATLRAQFGTDRQDDKVLEALFAKFNEDFDAALSDDFNSPQALAALFELLGALNTRTATHKAIHTASLEKGLSLVLQAFREVMGVPLQAAVDEGDEVVNDLISRREAARKGKNWAEADRIRAELSARQIVVEDTPQGPRWWRKE